MNAMKICQQCFFGSLCECVSSAPQSGADVMLSVTAENVDCFDSGVICRKSLLINIGRSFVVFDDDTGEPVRVTFRFVKEGHWLQLLFGV